MKTVHRWLAVNDLTSLHTLDISWLSVSDLIMPYRWKLVLPWDRRVYVPLKMRGHSREYGRVSQAQGILKGALVYETLKLEAQSASQSDVVQVQNTHIKFQLQTEAMKGDLPAEPLRLRRWYYQ